MLTPWISGFYASPIVALAPLLILWFGVGIWSKIAVVISLVIFPMIINTETGIKQADPQLIEAARSFGASPLADFRQSVAAERAAVTSSPACGSESDAA